MVSARACGNSAESSIFSNQRLLGLYKSGILNEFEFESQLLLFLTNGGTEK